MVTDIERCLMLSADIKMRELMSNIMHVLMFL